MDRLLQAILREDLISFVRKVFATVSPGTRYLHNWHVDAIVHQLMRVHAGQSRRLLISQPPRSLKSICVSIAYVACEIPSNMALERFGARAWIVTSATSFFTTEKRDPENVSNEVASITRSTSAANRTAPTA